MAESVDALVSNTSRFTPVPVRPRLWVLKRGTKVSLFFCSGMYVGEGLWGHPKKGIDYAKIATY